MENKKAQLPPVRSSTTEYLIYIAATCEISDNIEMRYENENIWLTQKMLATLYESQSLPSISILNSSMPITNCSLLQRLRIS